VRNQRANDRIVAEREKLMSEIVLRARVGDLPPMHAKARILLTRYWAKGSWRTRAELLPVARMLVVLGAAQPNVQPTRKTARKPPGARRAAFAARKRPGMA
jgi:hypothetical protein